MSNYTDLLTPVGRIVMGNLYEPRTTDAEGNPLTYRKGPKVGQQRVEYYFALAIPKAGEAHWTATPWGLTIYGAGPVAFPALFSQNPQGPKDFAWKITDGDSRDSNSNGRIPAEREGCAGHWILHLTGGFAPSIYSSDGSQQMLEKGAVNPGDYVRVSGNITSNDSSQNPGIYLNHRMIAFAGYGQRIKFGPEAKTVFAGGAALPPGASATPLAAQDFNPAPANAPVTSGYAQQTGYQAPAQATLTTTTAVAPHTAILQVATPPPAPPPPAAQTRVMTALANGLTYEQYIASGWNDTQLIQNGLMTP